MPLEGGTEEGHARAWLSSEKRPKLLFHLRPARERQACKKPRDGARPGGRRGRCPPSISPLPPSAASARSQARRSCPSPGLTGYQHRPWGVAGGERVHMGAGGAAGAPPSGCPCCMKPSPAAPVLAQDQGGILGAGEREPVAGQPPLQRRAGPTTLVACGTSLRIQRCVAPGTAWSRGSWA